MAKKTEKTEAKTANDVERTNDQTYRAYLEIGGVRVATITIAAEDDDDAKNQLGRARPTYFEGVGEWTLEKTEQIPVKLDK